MILRKRKIKTPKEKYNILKISVVCYPDRNSLMSFVKNIDSEAQFKICTDWTFKVKTKYSYDHLMSYLITKSEFSRMKKGWFF